jgi:hypothetical protein
MGPHLEHPECFTESFPAPAEKKKAADIPAYQIKIVPNRPAVEFQNTPYRRNQESADPIIVR